MCDVKKQDLVIDESAKKECPRCHGKKVIPGTCVCDAEWRGTQVGEVWSDCQCNPEETCPLCAGTGTVLP